LERRRPLPSPGEAKVRTPPPLLSGEPAPRPSPWLPFPGTTSASCALWRLSVANPRAGIPDRGSIWLPKDSGSPEHSLFWGDCNRLMISWLHDSESIYHDTALFRNPPAPLTWRLCPARSRSVQFSNLRTVVRNDGRRPEGSAFRTNRGYSLFRGCLMLIGLLKFDSGSIEWTGLRNPSGGAPRPGWHGQCGWLQLFSPNVGNNNYGAKLPAGISQASTKFVLRSNSRFRSLGVGFK